jgi:hypothetical protein
MGKTVRFDVLAVAKATGFDEADRKIEHLSGTAKKSMSGLVVAAAALAPALIPIAAGAAAAGASFVALGAVGLLAFAGIKKEMAAGTPTGKQFTATIGTLKGNLAELEQTAARGVLTGFQSSVKSLQPLMPLVNRDTAELSSKLGDIVSHVMPGLVALFHTANPLFLGFADDLDKGAQGFERWATSSDGAKKFVAYAQQQLPKVEDFILSLATTVGHLAQGFAPFGGFILTDLTAFSKLVNAIPVPVLKVAAPLVLSLVVAIKAMAVAETISTKVKALSASLKELSAANVAAGGAALAGAGGIAALAYAIGTLVKGPLDKLLNETGGFTQAFSGLAGGTDTFKQALISSGGAVNDSVRSVAALSLQHTDLSNKLKASGVGLTDQTAALTGSDAQFNKLFDTLRSGGDVSNKTLIAFKVLREEFTSGQISAKDYLTTMGTLGGSVGSLLGSQVKAGVTIDGVTTSIDAQTTAAGLLKNALDRLNGASVSVEDTQNQFLDTLGQLKKAHDAGTRSIDQNSAKGRVNREVLVAAIKAANDHAQAIADQTAKTHTLAAAVKAGSADFKAHEDAIKRAAHAAGLDDAAVAALIKKLGKVPKTVVTAVNVRDKASAQLTTIKQNIAALKSKQIDITTYIKNVILPTVRTPSGSHDSRNPNARAVGGPVTGGRTYLVNELGQELFVSAAGVASPISGGRRLFTPRTSGSITTAASFARLRADIAGVAKSLGNLGSLSAAAQKAVTAVGRILPGVGAVERGLNAENRALQAVAGRRARIADALKAANQRLADAQKTLRDKAAAVASGLLSGFDLSTFGANQTAGGPTSAASILDAARAFADKMVAFRAQIIKLQKEGLNKNLLDQLIQQGPSAQADALATASRAQIKALNTQFARAGVTAARLGGLDAKSLYGAGVAAAKGIVAGLRSQERALDKQMERLGRILVRALNRALGIRSPSKVTELAGKFAVLGVVKGIDDNVHHASAAAGRLGAAAVPGYGNGSYPGKMRGGGDIYITVNAGAIANPTELPRLLIGALEKAFAAGETVAGGQRAMR